MDMLIGLAVANISQCLRIADHQAVNLTIFFKDFLIIYLFIYFWPHRVLAAARRLLSSCDAQAPGCVGSVVVAPGFQSTRAL